MSRRWTGVDYAWAVTGGLVTIVAGGIALLLTATPSKADIAELRGASGEEVLEYYVDYIRANSDYTCEGPLPEVRQYPDDVLRLEFYGPELVQQEAEGKVHLSKIAALYDSVSDVILAPEGKDWTSFDQSYVMVHELVHWCQDMAGMHETVNCPGELEVDAYAIHTKFMNDYDHPAARPDPLFLLLVTTCENDL